MIYRDMAASNNWKRCQDWMLNRAFFTYMWRVSAKNDKKPRTRPTGQSQDTAAGPHHRPRPTHPPRSTRGHMPPIEQQAGKVQESTQNPTHLSPGPAGLRGAPAFTPTHGFKGPKNHRQEKAASPHPSRPTTLEGQLVKTVPGSPGSSALSSKTLFLLNAG